ncbi:MAG: DUF342 domain-containing protein [Candidatus Sericytochromatia bacterium]|nr:DUF342 domain-containing protein [Candidatus Sericytochromatia bacterium]
MFDPRVVLRVSDDQRAVIALAAPGPDAVSPEMVRALIDREGFGDYYIDEDALLTFCRQVALGKTAVSAVIAERRDGEVIVTVTGSGDAAYLTLIPPFGGQPHARPDLVAALERSGAKTGILQDIVDRASRLIKADKILIAQAIAPSTGEDARFTPLIQPSSYVSADTPLMRRTPPTNGQPGETVTGLPIPPQPGADLTWGPLSGCQASANDGNTLVATQDGVVSFSQRGATVSASCTIDVTVAPNGFSALVSFAPTPGGRGPTRDQLERALARAGVRAGILEDALAQASTIPATRDFLVAQAVMAQPGDSSRFVPLVPEDTWVESSAPLMRRLPPSAGKPGMTVTGEPLPSQQPGQLIPFYAGDGASPDARQPEMLRATHAGKVRFNEHGATVLRACHVSVQVAPDGLVAYLTLREGTGEAHRQRPLILEALAEAGVIAGRLEDAIDEAAGSPSVSGLLVARGQKPKAGTAGKLELLVDAHQRLVSAGTPLVRRIPNVPGEAGFTVTGETVTPPALTDAIEFDLRPGTMADPSDANVLVAAASGQVMLGQGWVEVGGITQVDTVTASTPINAEESVVVSGSVEAGGQIISKGDIVVMGDVTSARIEAEGTVEIIGTISGDAQIKAKGPVRIGELQGGSIESDAGVYVRTGIHNGQVNAMGPVEVAEGGITGGRVASLTGISANVIGSPDGEPTQIDIGPSPAWQLKLTSVTQSRDEMQGKIDEASRSLIHLKIKGRDHAHPRTMQLLEQQRAKLVDQATTLDGDKARLTAQLSMKGPGQVVAKELVHPGVKLTFSNIAQSLHLVRTVEAAIPGAVFSVRGGQIIAIPSVKTTFRPSDLPMTGLAP